MNSEKATAGSESGDESLGACLSAKLLHQLDQAMLKIRHCLSQLSSEQVWWRPAPEMNSIGNLLLHIEGNLGQWAVAGVGRAPDQRDRQAEFDQAEIISPEHLLARLQQTVEETRSVCKSLSENDWLTRRKIQGFDVPVLEALLHTFTHFVGHAHQIILLTRLQLGSDYCYHWTPESPRGNVPI